MSRSAGGGAPRAAALALAPLIAALAWPASAGETVVPETTVAAEASEETWGRSELDLALETFLATADVVKIEDIGDGITRPARLTLKDGPTTVRAIFKTVDIRESQVSFRERFEMNFTDRYVYEVAAYRMDRYLGIGLVPPTVLRTIDGVEGSVQFWIEKAVKMEDLVQEGQPIQDTEAYFRRMLQMRVLDALIYNTDRNRSNILVTSDDDGFHLIDHSRAFRVYKKIPKWKEDWVEGKLPDDVAARLHALDEEILESLLGGLLEDRLIRPILKRRDALVKELRKRGHLS